LANKQDEETLVLLVGLAVLFYAYSKGYLDTIIDQLSDILQGGTGTIVLPPVSGGGGSGGGAGGPQPSGELDANGVKMIYATTGQRVDLDGPSDPNGNGDRYAAQHTFTNYMIMAYLHTGSGQEAIGCKTDGPNHGKCQSMKPTCLWVDPDLQISDCSIKYGAEYPHPKSNPLQCDSCKSCGMSLDNKWIGYASIAYEGPGGPSDRWNEVWVDTGGLDASGKPANQWMQLLKENYTEQIPAEWQRPNGLPVDCSNCGSGTGLEGEIRMRGSNGTEMKYGAIIEIENPGSSSTTTPPPAEEESAYARSYYSYTSTPTIYSYNRISY